MGNGENLRKVRIDHKITQTELGCKNIERYVINKIEKGKQEMNQKQAMILANRFIEILKIKGLEPLYPINADILLGKKSIMIDELIIQLKNNIDNSSDIDNALKSMDNDESIKFLKKIINVLIEEISSNGDRVKEYCHKLLNLNIDRETKIITYNNLIKACHSLGQFKEAIVFAKFINDEIENIIDDKVKVSFYSNVAKSFLKEEKYNECLLFIDKGKLYNKDEEEDLIFLTLEADAYSMLREFKNAEKGYLNVINKSNKTGNYNYSINAYSNIADIYRKNCDLEVAKRYINIAIEELGKFEVNTIFKLNVYFNYLLISIVESNIDDIERYSDISLQLAIKTNNTQKQNRIILELVEFYIKNNMEQKINKLIKNISKYNMKLDYEVAVKISLLINNKQKIHDVLKMCYNSSR